MREITREPGATAWKPRLNAISTLSGDRRAVYPALAAGADGFLVAWTEDGDAGSEIRVRRIGR
jgi:hypothetical protein